MTLFEVLRTGKPYKRSIDPEPRSACPVFTREDVEANDWEVINEERVTRKAAIPAPFRFAYMSDTGHIRFAESDDTAEFVDRKWFRAPWLDKPETALDLLAPFFESRLPRRSGKATSG